MKEYSKGYIDIDGLDLENTTVWVDPPGSQRVAGLPLIDLVRIIEHAINDRDVNVKSVKMEEPLSPPGTSSELEASYIAVDDNYFYVWVKNKWKRTILSDWN